jgi:hypothetical protein
MRKYSVWMDNVRMIEVSADDVNLEIVEGNAYWNFINNVGDDDSVTVAAFPFTTERYIVSSV